MSGLVTRPVRPIYRPRFAPFSFYSRPPHTAKWTEHRYATLAAAMERAARLRELGYETDGTRSVPLIPPALPRDRGKVTAVHGPITDGEHQDNTHGHEPRSSD